MNKKKRKITNSHDVKAPGIDPDEAYGEPATETDIKKGESTTVTRLRYNEYEPSEKKD